MRLVDRLRSLYRRVSKTMALPLWLKAASTKSRFDANGVPIPPGHLIYLVAGTSDLDWFLGSGELGAKALRDVLRSNHADIAEFGSILDFGCGVGRVVRHLPALTGARLFGCDYNPKLVRWCQKNLSFGRFSTNAFMAKLPYEDNQFDLIFALSIFTHLTEAQQTFWLDELGRVLKAGGFLFLTTHGLSYERHIPENLRESFRRGELVVLQGDRAGENDCAAFHPEEFVRNTLAREWRVADFLSEGALGNPTQDVYLLQKKSSPQPGRS